MVPLKLHKEATGDGLLQNVTRSNDAIVAFGGSKMRLAGRVLLPVSRGDTGAHCVAIWLMLKFVLCWDGRLV